MKILGFELTKDYETPIKLRKELIENLSENDKDFYIKWGFPKSYNKKYWWSVHGPGIFFTKYCATLQGALKSLFTGLTRYLRDPKAYRDFYKENIQG